ncbi:uncharacterized protein L203_100016 [Cryptococcus depauperatus CBS 7841]|uniref:Uncharacterized protein n=1 Tax=Cryptococcus depauperatus CBS 7841 TaxID=1295531 RepID=A0AAJ8LV05_9TREE
MSTHSFTFTFIPKVKLGHLGVETIERKGSIYNNSPEDVQTTRFSNHPTESYFTARPCVRWDAPKNVEVSYQTTNTMGQAKFP